MVKLFSNFDTWAPAENYWEAVQEFGFDKVIFLRRHALYFYLYTLTPAISAVILFWYMCFSMFNPIDTNSINTQHIIEIIILLLIIYLVLLSWSKYFNYTLDYTIITSRYISSYNQKWIFAREITTIEPEKIKTINFSSKWLINSLFNFGTVSILLEGDDMAKWEIVIDFIYNPEWVKEGIQDLTRDTIKII